MTIGHPYVFEFLGLKPFEALDEMSLERLLLGRWPEFLLGIGYRPRSRLNIY
jgi:predicted nuclease of restriction endonuclease-like (RecB) superfamily